MCVCGGGGHVCLHKISTAYHTHYAVKLATSISTSPHSYNHTMIHKVQIHFTNKHKLSSFTLRNTCAHYTPHPPAPPKSCLSCGCWGVGLGAGEPSAPVSPVTRTSHRSCCTSTSLLIGVAVPPCHLTVHLHSPSFRSRDGKQKWEKIDMEIRDSSFYKRKVVPTKTEMPTCARR